MSTRQTDEVDELDENDTLPETQRVAHGVGLKWSENGVLHYYHDFALCSSPSVANRFSPSPPAFEIRLVDKWEDPEPLSFLNLPRELMLACLPAQKKHRRAAQFALMRTCTALSRPMADALYSSLDIHPRRLVFILRCVVRAENNPWTSVGGKFWMASMLAKVPSIKLDLFDPKRWSNQIEGISSVRRLLPQRVLFPNLESVIFDIPYEALALPPGMEHPYALTAIIVLDFCRAKHICYLGSPVPKGDFLLAEPIRPSFLRRKTHLLGAKVVTFHNVISHSTHIGAPAPLNRVIVQPDPSLVGTQSLFWWVEQQSDLFVEWMKSGDKNSMRKPEEGMQEKWEFYQSGSPPFESFDWSSWKSETKGELLPGSRDYEVARHLERRVWDKYPAAKGRMRMFTFAESASNACGGCGRRLGKVN